MKRYAFSRRTRFRFVEQGDSDAGDFEIERRTPSGHLMASSLEHGGERTFTLLDLRQAIAEDRLHFHRFSCRRVGAGRLTPGGSVYVVPAL